MLYGLIGQKLTVQWKDLLFLDRGNEWFCVLGIFSPAPASAADETCETSKLTIILMDDHQTFLRNENAN